MTGKPFIVYPVVYQAMTREKGVDPFTKAQRIKGLKKQLKNLGEEVEVEESNGETSSPEDRGFHLAAAWQRKEDAF